VETLVVLAPPALDAPPVNLVLVVADLPPDTL
jgi:hypothetical protein